MLIVPRPCLPGLLVPRKRGLPPLVVPRTGCEAATPVPVIAFEVNSPDLGGFVPVAVGGGVVAGNLAQTGAAGPFTEHDGQLEIRILNLGSVDLNIAAPVFTPTAGYGFGSAVEAAPFTSPIPPGGSTTQFINNITSDGLPVPFVLDVSVTSDDPVNPVATLQVTGSFTP